MVQSASKDAMRRLVDGEIPWDEAKELLHINPKEDGRFRTYMEVLKEKWKFDDELLLRISEHLYIVRKKEGSRVVKCDCGHEFGDYRANWKLSSKVYVRRTKEELAEVMTIEPRNYPNPKLVEVREWYCPGCFAQIGVDVVPRGYPVLWEFFPDIDTFYREWLDVPLKDQRPDWYEDKTPERVAQWAHKTSGG